MHVCQMCIENIDHVNVVAGEGSRSWESKLWFRKVGRQANCLVIGIGICGNIVMRQTGELGLG